MIMTGGVIGVVVVFSALLVYPQIANAGDAAFRQSWNAIAFETNDLTREDQAHEGKWKSGEYTNQEMAEIVDTYSPRYKSLIEKAEAMDAPDKYQTSKDLLIKSIDSERISNEHLKNYLVTGNENELRKSEEILSLSLRYSAEADAAVLAAG